MKMFGHTALDHLKDGYRKRKKLILFSLGSFVAIAIIATGSIFAYAEYYQDKIYPNVLVGDHNLGGLTQNEASALLNNSFNSMLNRGLMLSLEGEEKMIELRVTGATDPDLIYNFIDFDVDNTVQDAFAIGRTKGNFLFALFKIISPSGVDSRTTVLEEPLKQVIQSAFTDFEEPSENTGFEITKKGDEFIVLATLGKQGSEIDTEKAIATLRQDIKNFELDTIDLTIKESANIVSIAQAESLQTEIEKVLLAAPYTLTQIANDQRQYDWSIKESDLIDWLIPVFNENNQVVLSLDTEAMDDFLTTIRDDVDSKPKNARFLIEDGRVKEFAGSLNGETFNDEKTIAALIDQLGVEEVKLAIAVDVVEPEITTDSVNDLGIKEIIGVGVSDFAGSPSNRIKNITHGSNKLNGILIPPGGQLSLIEELRPFTLADGYLPELVIKGDDIIPEIGGGLCQLGTTAFRAVMNSGLQIDQRRNHSLVVSYYNDPKNGNPGTDATLYDPNPDFKFTNDTENYILLTTKVDLNKMELVYTFWGTSDGRKGNYTPPEVLVWRGYGATQYTETTDLPPGVEKCQAPHPGATASFDYNVEYADGTSFTKNYTSTYRSLPRICLVGVDPDAPDEEEDEGAGDEVTEIDEDTPASEVPEELKVGDIVE